jgi:hypothetical protein
MLIRGKGLREKKKSVYEPFAILQNLDPSHVDEGPSPTLGTV